MANYLLFRLLNIIQDKIGSEQYIWNYEYNLSIQRLHVII